MTSVAHPAPFPPIYRLAGRESGAALGSGHQVGIRLFHRIVA